MKKILLSLVTIAVLTACNSKPEGYTINGTVIGEVADSTKVYLTKISAERQRVNLDSTLVKDGKFVLKGVADSIPEMRFLFIGELMGYTPLVIENGEIELTAKKDSLNSAKVKGTLQNDAFADYLKNSRENLQRSGSIQQDMQYARASKDTVTFNSLQEEFAELIDEAKNFDVNFIKKNPNSLIAALLIDNGLTQRRFSNEEVKELYELLTPIIKNTEAAQGISKKIEAIRVNEERSKSTEVGAKAPNFSGPSPTGEQLALADVMGKVTLIDFWAAWCRPCRAENPNIVAAYKKYHDKGLNVIGVSLDRKAEDWKKAIADDGLTWNHVSNVAYFNDPIAQLYNIQAIPAAFLLDENGIIVAKNLRGTALEQKVAELLD